MAKKLMTAERTALFIAACVVLSVVALGFRDRDPGYNTFATEFRTTRASHTSHNFPKAGLRKRSRATRRFDVVTPHGWRGSIGHDAAHDRIVMDLKDVLDRPVPDIAVVAEFAVDGQLRPQTIRNLVQVAGGEYRAENLGLDQGRWDVTVTGRDLSTSRGTGFLFRVEKQIEVQ